MIIQKPAELEHRPRRSALEFVTLITIFFRIVGWKPCNLRFPRAVATGTTMYTDTGGQLHRISRGAVVRWSRWCYGLIHLSYQGRTGDERVGNIFWSGMMHVLDHLFCC